MDNQCNRCLKRTVCIFKTPKKNMEENFSMAGETPFETSLSCPEFVQGNPITDGVEFQEFFQNIVKEIQENPDMDLFDEDGGNEVDDGISGEPMQ